MLGLFNEMVYFWLVINIIIIKEIKYLPEKWIGFSKMDALNTSEPDEFPRRTDIYWHEKRGSRKSMSPFFFCCDVLTWKQDFW